MATFSSRDRDHLPSGWLAAHTGRGEGSIWRIIQDDSAPSGAGFVLAQLAHSPKSMCNLCILKKGLYRDVKLKTALKSIKGETDQGGGLVWRCLDANNYYLCRYNPLEDNFRIYKVIAGKRALLASLDLSVTHEGWHEITALMRGNLIVCTLDGAELAVRDDTLTVAGRVGLWTKADAQTAFDALRVTGKETSEARRDQ